MGEVVPLYCTDFELDPELDGWDNERFEASAAPEATIGTNACELEVVTHRERIQDDGLSKRPRWRNQRPELQWLVSQQHHKPNA